MATSTNITAASFTSLLTAWKAGERSQIKAIRTALVNIDNDGGQMLAAALTVQTQGNTVNKFYKKDVRSFNAAMQRECKRTVKSVKAGEKVAVYPTLVDAPKGFEMDSKTLVVTFGDAKTADNKKEKDPVLVAYALLKSASKATPENQAIICNLIATMMA